MRVQFGNLLFEQGDVLHIEDEDIKTTFTVVNGHDCSRCGFYSICDNRNPKNIVAKFCKDVHFVEL